MIFFLHPYFSSFTRSGSFIRDDFSSFYSSIIRHSTPSTKIYMYNSTGGGGYWPPWRWWWTMIMIITTMSVTTRKKFFSILLVLQTHCISNNVRLISSKQTLLIISRPWFIFLQRKFKMVIASVPMPISMVMSMPIIISVLISRKGWIFFVISTIQSLLRNVCFNLCNLDVQMHPQIQIQM